MLFDKLASIIHKLSLKPKLFPRSAWENGSLRKKMKISHHRPDMPLTVVLVIALAMTAQTRRLWEEKGDFEKGVDLPGGKFTYSYSGGIQCNDHRSGIFAGYPRNSCFNIRLIQRRAYSCQINPSSVRQLHLPLTAVSPEWACTELGFRTRAVTLCPAYTIAQLVSQGWTNRTYRALRPPR